MDNQIKYSIPKNVAEHFSPIEQRLIKSMLKFAPSLAFRWTNLCRTATQLITT